MQPASSRSRIQTHVSVSTVLTLNCSAILPPIVNYVINTIIVFNSINVVLKNTYAPKVIF